MSPGLRSVKLEYLEKGKVVASAEQAVAVHPLWSQEKDCPKDIFRDQRRIFLTAEAAHAPLDDILNVFRIGDAVGNAKLTGRAATAALDRWAEFKPGQAQSLYDLAFFFQRPAVKEYALAEKAFAGLLKLDAVDPRLRETARLHLAGLRLHMLDRADASQTDLQALDASRLTDSDRRMKAIYEGDLLLAQGRVDAARQAYLAAGTLADPGDTRYAIRRRARIESARNYLLRSEYNDAERVIREIEWETPIERLNTETTLMRVQCHIGRQEYPAAFACCRRLLKAAETDARRPDLLYDLIEVALALGRRQDAEDAYRQLLKDHPYSEAAARAKEKWEGTLR
jgi:tetratricopeptide (TPR) repeat protein